ncbi:hypothetical protein TA3x_004228 [Tundrisphaera sp. TA3]|uniref:hypothetical protein n=1 Tax=Tundrisphaera sp. TA3 TaxID=3435775 RepID=UPI003EB7B88C
MTTHGAGSEPLRIGPTQGDSPLATRIEDRITARANGRIRDLHVVCSGDVIILHGWSRTYHAKQLAQEAALDLLDHHGLPSFLNQIVVA